MLEIHLARVLRSIRRVLNGGAAWHMSTRSSVARCSLPQPLCTVLRSGIWPFRGGSATFGEPATGGGDHGGPEREWWPGFRALLPQISVCLIANLAQSLSASR